MAIRNRGIAVRQNSLQVYVHFVWGTWNRESFITGDIERGLYRYMEGVCRKRGCEVLAIGGMPDHVHLLVALPSSITMGDLMEFVKGASSYFLSHELKPGTAFKWQGNYGARSVSPHDKQRLIRYIEHQREHHGLGDIWPGAEDMFKSVSPAEAGGGPQAPER